MADRPRILPKWHAVCCLKFSLDCADNGGMLRVSRETKGLTMSPDGTYNGYANYQTWNICLWISNDEGLNEFAAVCQDYNDFKARLREMDINSAIAYETPDGVAWNDSSVNLAEMREFWEDNFSKAAA
jgi:hypothetical protein